MSKIELILLSLRDMIVDAVNKSQTEKDVEDFVRWMQLRVAIEEYIAKYGAEGTEAVETMQEGIGRFWGVSRVESEIKAAEAYINKWREVANELYKTLASDELRHATLILESSPDITPEQAITLRKRIQMLTASLEKPAK